jgi:hypothetical protein
MGIPMSETKEIVTTKDKKQIRFNHRWTRMNTDKDKGNPLKTPVNL